MKGLRVSLHGSRRARLDGRLWPGAIDTAPVTPVMANNDVRHKIKREIPPNLKACAKPFRRIVS
jgi:hypothetical protein